MDKNLAFLVFPFYFIFSPIVALMNEETLEKTNERIWLRLNGYEER